MGGGAYSYGGGGWVVNAGVCANVDAVTLDRGRVELGTGGV